MSSSSTTLHPHQIQPSKNILDQSNSSIQTIAAGNFQHQHHHHHQQQQQQQQQESLVTSSSAGPSNNPNFCKTLNRDYSGHRNSNNALNNPSPNHKFCSSHPVPQGLSQNLDTDDDVVNDFSRNGHKRMVLEVNSTIFRAEDSVYPQKSADGGNYIGMFIPNSSVFIESSESPQNTTNKNNLIYTDLLAMDHLLADGCCPDDTGFESACGSPANPVDLSTLDGISLDFPLNSNCDIAYNDKGSSSGDQGHSSTSLLDLNELNRAEPPKSKPNPNNSATNSSNNNSNNIRASPVTFHSLISKTTSSTSNNTTSSENPWESCSRSSSSSNSSSRNSQSEGGSRSSNRASFSNSSMLNKKETDDVKSLSSSSCVKRQQDRHLVMNIDGQVTGTDVMDVERSEIALKGTGGAAPPKGDCKISTEKAHVDFNDSSSSSTSSFQFPAKCHHTFAASSSSSTSPVKDRSIEGGTQLGNNRIQFSSQGENELNDENKRVKRRSSSNHYEAARLRLDSRETSINQRQQPVQPSTSTSDQRRMISDKDAASKIQTHMMHCYEGDAMNNNNNNINKLIEGLNPIFPESQREMQNGLWFRCQLCQNVYETNQLFCHAREAHHITDPGTATSHCISPCKSSASPNMLLGSREQNWNSGTSFMNNSQNEILLHPLSHEIPHENKRLRLMQQQQQQQQPAEEQISSLIRLEQIQQHPISCSMTTSTLIKDEESPSASMTPLSHNHHNNHPLTHLNYHHEQDLSDVVDEKFIDSLLMRNPSSSNGNEMSLSSQPENLPRKGSHNNLIENAQQQKSSLTALNSRPKCSMVQLQPVVARKSQVSSAAASSSSFPLPPSAPAGTVPTSSHHSTLPKSPISSSSTNGTSLGVNTKVSSSREKTPQFRWRRRKRRSKAQYPEMSRYLLPIDDGDEVQHLGRTLECQLCGLRGKRCHLTLHFKAKHSEVIELEHRNKVLQPQQSPAQHSERAASTFKATAAGGTAFQNNNNKVNNGPTQHKSKNGVLQLQQQSSNIGSSSLPSLGKMKKSSDSNNNNR